ncbi:MAG: hypothetical protein ACKPKO_43230, partial [Candidatus Fonsibacter sp.]
MAQLDTSRKDIGKAVSRSIEHVVDSLTSVNHTVQQLELEKGAAELAAAVSGIHQPSAPATSSVDPHGSRQGDAEMGMSSDTPAPSAFKVDAETELPELAAEYNLDLEEPSMFDPENATVLSPQIWPTVEGN